ncbi:MAG: hypothetical protein ACUVX8_08820 [Candidatus Zipacnadales bacterium]
MIHTHWRRRGLGLLQVYRWVDLDNSGRDRRLWRGPLDLFDRFALGLMAVFVLVLVLRADGLQPFISDTYYHLVVAKQIALGGKIPAWGDWDYAPVGRPHLYPPLLHLILAGLARLTGGILSAGQVLAVLFLPASLLTCWYAARWVFDSRTALVALLALSLDCGHAVVELIYIPSCLVNLLVPPLLITVLTRRTWASIVLLTLMLYAHLGIPYLVVLGLVLFALKYPRYRSEVLKVVGVSLLWVSPWMLRTWLHREWIVDVTTHGGLPMSVWKRILSLQMFNGVLIGCGLWGLRNLRKSRVQETIVRWMLVGMLPLLFSYGGRFTMHAAPLFALSAGTVLVKLIPARPSWKHAAALTVATLLPAPGLIPLTATHAIVLLALQGRPLMGSDRHKSEAYLEDCDEAIDWIKAHTQPREVVYVNKEWLGDLVPLLTDRRTDFGCWWECSRQIGRIQNRWYRDDGRRAVFLGIRPESDTGSILGPTKALPRLDYQTTSGRFQVGIRYERRFSLRKALENFDSGKATAWRVAGKDPSAVSVTASRAVPKRNVAHRYLSWEIPAESHETRLERPVRLGQAAGLAMNVRASAPLGEVRLTLQEHDGSTYQWELALPCVAEPIDPAEIERALWVRVRVPFDLMTLGEGQSDENERLDPDQVVRLGLVGPKKPHRRLRIDIDDIELMDVKVISERENGG